MTHASLRRKLAFLLLLAFFAAPWATLAGERPGGQPWQTAAVQPHELAGRLWRLLTRVWSETGCRLDPDGLCLPNTGAAPAASTQGDTGCRIDPSGRCLPGTGGAPAATSQSDTGCMIDPGGRCVS